MTEKSNRESQIQAQDCSKDCNLILQMVEMVLLYPTDIYSMAPTSSLGELEKSTSKAHGVQSPSYFHGPDERLLKTSVTKSQALYKSQLSSR